MKLKFNKEGKSEETLKAYDAMEKDISIDGGLSKEDVTKAVQEETKEIKAQLNADNPESIVNAVKNIREKVDNLSAEAQRSKTNKIQTVEEIFTKEVDIESVKAGKSQEFEIKAATAITVGAYPVTASDINQVVSVYREGGLNAAPISPRKISQFVDLGSTNSPIIVWMNKANVQGNAAFIGEGELKPLRSWQVTPEDSKAKKEAVRFKVSTEALDDIPGLMSDLKADGLEELDKVLAEKMLSGDGTGNNIIGIIPKSSAYALTTIKGLTPDNMGAIRAAIAQVTSLNYTPNAVFINPIDAANMDLVKGSDGHYVIPPFKSATGLNIAGLPVIETNEVAVGKFLVGDFKKYHVRTYKGVRIEMGLDSDDFSKNMRTIVVEQRLHAFVKSVNTGAFVYDTFATVKTAITQA